MTLSEFEQKIKIKKWWEWIPIVGTVIYSVRVDLARQNLAKKEAKGIAMYSHIFKGVTFLVGILFLTIFLVLRNKHGFGPWPWFFFVGLSFGLLANISSLVPQTLFKLGIKRFKNIKEKQKQVK